MASLWLNAHTYECVCRERRGRVVFSELRVNYPWPASGVTLSDTTTEYSS